MATTIENTTKFPLTVFVLVNSADPKSPEKWRAVIGNVDDRNRLLPVVNADGIVIPGKTERIPDGRPAPVDAWRGKLPSPVVTFSDAEWEELKKSPSWQVLEAHVRNGDFIQRHAPEGAKKAA